MKIIFLIIIKYIIKIVNWMAKLKSGYKYDILIIGNYDHLPDDQKLLLERLEKENITHRFLFNVEQNMFFKKLLAYMKCAFLSAKAKNIIVFDYCMPMYCIKKLPEQKIFQLWHANGSFKRFGIPNFKEKHGEKLANKLYSIVPIHSTYDYIFVSNKKCIPYYMEAFNDYSEEKYLVSNNILLDLFIEKTGEVSYKKDKKVINILLAKTYTYQSENDIYEQLGDFLSEEAEKYGVKVNVSTLLHPKLAPNFDKINVMARCDLLITDFSSVCFEAAAIGKEVAFLRGPQTSELFVEVAKKVYYDPKELAIDILERKLVDNRLNDYLTADGAKQLDMVIELIKPDYIPEEIVTPVLPANNISVGS